MDFNARGTSHMVQFKSGFDPMNYVSLYDTQSQGYHICKDGRWVTKVGSK